MTENIQTALGDDGVLIATIDMPGRSMNVFSEALMDAVEALLDKADDDDGVQAVVVTSAKPAFLAGADLQLISGFAERALTDSEDVLNAFYGRLNRMFRRLERSRKPYVAAINGLALGGGLELAMACHQRVVVDDPRAVLGLPEIKLGLLPGAGGTQRLPSLVGVKTGLKMLLLGEPVQPSTALDIGLVDEVVESGRLIPAARARALSLVASGSPADAPRPEDAQGHDFAADDIEQQIAGPLGLTQEQLQDYPAYRAIIDCVAGGWALDWDEAFEHEITVFTKLMQATPVAGNMVRTLFLNLQRAGKQLQKPRSHDLAIDPALDEKLRGKLEQAYTCKSLAEAGSDDVALLLPGSVCNAGICIRLLEPAADADNKDPAEGTSMYLAPATANGRAVEIQSDDEQARGVALGLAAAMRCTPLVSSGGALLPRLLATRAAVADLPRPQQLLACSLAAVRLEEQGSEFDRELADVASVLSGAMPAFSGGVFTHWKQTANESISEIVGQVPARHADLFTLPGTARI